MFNVEYKGSKMKFSNLDKNISSYLIIGLIKYASSISSMCKLKCALFGNNFLGLCISNIFLNSGFNIAKKGLVYDDALYCICGFGLLYPQPQVSCFSSFLQSLNLNETNKIIVMINMKIN